ncbi:MAG: hypothetical protein DSY46_04720 [Hydrogenimonas sp.]|nr:MAG: hypothetical protein DSY46_04720 [Hydrogenimonas sp.]
MAGIGFEIRKILKDETIFSIVKAFSYAGIVSSGPWIISMLSILIAGYVANFFFDNQQMVVDFTIMITYVIAFSLILTSYSQLSFTRFVSDMLFAKKRHKVLPNALGVMVVNIVIGMVFILPWTLSIYYETHSLFIASTFELTFIVLCSIWIVNIVLTGVKNYKYVIFSFFIAYLLIILLIFWFDKGDLESYLLSFLIGQTVLLLLLMVLMFKEFQSDHWIAFDFFKKVYKDLVWIGLFLNGSIWIDKFIFWLNPFTNSEGIGLLKYSPIYDYPIFLAYLSIAPAMAVFLLRIETDFAIFYDKYFSAAREGGTLKELYLYANEMIDSARVGLIEILRIQTLIGFLIVLFAEAIFEVFTIPTVYIPLFIVDLIGTTLQVFFMSIVTILFYLDKRREILALVILLFFLNFCLTLYSQYLGPYYYGYGAALAYFIVSLFGLLLLNQSFKRFHYETFMLI